MIQDVGIAGIVGYIDSDHSRERELGMTTAAVASVADALLTAEEFAHRPEPQDGSREELVKGVVQKMPMPRFGHGRVQLRIGRLLAEVVDKQALGHVATETGVITELDPDTVRGPDVAFWSKERLPLDSHVEVYPDVAPDLCVEIRSPEERPKRVRTKLSEYFACGVRMVWVIDPEAQSVTVDRQADEGRVLWENATLSGEDVLPEFSCRVSDLFA